jgi:crotonobetainyl-CoA:carnitine CoA-transferase CaiB-like acyl-CoA transferase
LLDGYVGDWIAERDLDLVVATFEKAEAAVAPIYDIRHIMADPQFQALDSVTTVQDDELGPLKMQNVLFRLSETPGMIRFAGRRVGQDNEAVYGELGLKLDELQALEAQGIL